jgi:hypothetical protein
MFIRCFQEPLWVTSRLTTMKTFKRISICITLKSGVPVFLVHKGDDDGKWHRRVVSELAGAPIERSLPVLRQGSVPQSSMPRQASQRHQSGTFLRAALVRDIRQNWKLLEPELKDRIKRYFTVDENHDPVIVR